MYLDTKIPPIYVVAEEQIASVGGITTNFEELHQIVLETNKSAIHW